MQKELLIEESLLLYLQSQPPQERQQKFDSFTDQQKIELGLQITRKLIAGVQIFDDGEKNSLVISDDLESLTFQNIEVSPFPTQSRQIMKYVETSKLSQFIDKKKLVQVDEFYSLIFVNLEDLSYHNFENILNLDRHFNNAKFHLKSQKKIRGKNNIQMFHIQGSTDVLLSLDNLNYYTQPLNSTQRGGKRLIFHSNQLAYSLTKMIQESDFFEKKNFKHVNNVFRLNNFSPGDKKFKSHYDTPFSDKKNKLFSKYTMIIYLTGSKKSKISQPPLVIEDYVVENIQENTCIIFDQKCKHEGNSFADKNKIFIRTELIFKILNYSEDEKVARLFNMACYMTKEINQQQYSADLFNQCVKMRYNIDQPNEEKLDKVYLIKRNLEIVYITDGNYFWFPIHVPLQLIGSLIILDYFNGKVYDLENVNIISKLLDLTKFQNTESDENLLDILEFINFKDEKIDKSRSSQFQNVSDFVPDSLLEEFVIFPHNSKDEYCQLNDITCKDTFELSQNHAIQNCENILKKNNVLIFDNLIKINQDSITIKQNDQVNGKIRFCNFYLQTERKVNFASVYVEPCGCKQLYSEDDVILYNDKSIHTFYLPDIPFQKFEKGYKLSIDIFNNGFIYHSTENFSQPYTNEDELEKAESDKQESSSEEDEDLNSDSNQEEDNDSISQKSSSQPQQSEDDNDFKDMNSNPDKNNNDYSRQNSEDQSSQSEDRNDISDKDSNIHSKVETSANDLNQKQNSKKINSNKFFKQQLQDSEVDQDRNSQVSSDSDQEQEYYAQDQYQEKSINIFKQQIPKKQRSKIGINLLNKQKKLVQKF